MCQIMGGNWIAWHIHVYVKVCWCARHELKKMLFEIFEIAYEAVRE